MLTAEASRWKNEVAARRASLAVFNLEGIL